MHVRYINHKFSSLLAHGCLALAFPDFSGFFSCIYPGFFLFLGGAGGGAYLSPILLGKVGLVRERFIYIFFYNKPRAPTLRFPLKGKKGEKKPSLLFIY